MNKNLKNKQKMNGNFVRVVEIPSVFLCFGCVLEIRGEEIIFLPVENMGI